MLVTYLIALVSYHVSKLWQMRSEMAHYLPQNVQRQTSGWDGLEAPLK